MVAVIAWLLGAPWVYCLLGGGAVAFFFVALWLATDSIARRIPTDDQIYGEIEVFRRVIIEHLMQTETEHPPQQAESADPISDE